jgi:hypothetical protein
VYDELIYLKKKEKKKKIIFLVQLILPIEPKRKKS